MDFAFSADTKVKNEKNEKRNKYLDLAREQETMEHESDGDTNCNWYTRSSHQRIGTMTGELGNKRINEDHRPEY